LLTSYALKAQIPDYYYYYGEKYGPIFQTFYYGYPGVVVTDVDTIKSMLVDPAFYKQLLYPEIE
jgi:hypothetical protein